MNKKYYTALIPFNQKQRTMKKKNKIEAMSDREFQLYTDRVERTFTAALYAAVILVFAAIVATWLYILPQYELWRAEIDEKVEQVQAPTG